MMQKLKLNYNSTSNSGFTIVEVMISLILLSILMVGVITITNDSTEKKDRIVDEDREYLQMEMVLQRMEWDLTQIYTPLYYAGKPKPKEKTQNEKDEDYLVSDRNESNMYQGNKRFAFANSNGHPVPIYRNPEKNIFEFLSMANRRRVRDVPQSKFTWIKYSLIKMPDNYQKKENDERDNRSLYALIRTADPYDPYNHQEDSLDKIKYQVLLYNVKEIEFNFWSPKDLHEGKYVEKLSEIDEKKDRPKGENLLRAILFKLVWIDRFNKEVKVEKIFRPITPYYVEKIEDDKNKGTSSDDGTLVNDDDNEEIDEENNPDDQK